MRVLVTRPQYEALHWVNELRLAGLEAQALPLITIASLADAPDLRQAWLHLHEYAGVMFVSGNAVTHFFAARPVAVAPWGTPTGSPAPRAWAPGPGTADALRRAGLAAEWIDAPAKDAGQFDSEALWAVVGHQVQAGQRVLVVRGGGAAQGQGSGRDWFANQVLAAGAQVVPVMAYQRCAPEFTADESRLAQQAATDGSVWLFSSSEAINNLCRFLPDQSWRQARALATHPRIAAAARQAGFATVLESRPSLPEVVASVKGLEHVPG